MTLTTTTESACSESGQLVDSLKRFPHHVTIETDRNSKYQICGGSILNDRWIVTSAYCIDGSDSLRLHFEKLYRYSTNGSFSIVVNKDEVWMHPTNYYDIALIRMPVKLIFSETLWRIEISSRPSYQLESRLGVITGFDSSCLQTTTTTTTTTPYTTPTTTPSITITTTPSTTTTTTTEIEYSSIETTTPEESSTSTEGSTTTSTTTDTSTTEQSSTEDSANTAETSNLRLQRRLNSFAKVRSAVQQPQLMYGMLRILSKGKCSASDNDIDEFLQICTESWLPNSSDSNPCWNYGSGLITGWPGNPQLVGIYSVMLNDCSSSKPAVYTNLVEFLPWIESVINDYDVNP